MKNKTLATTNAVIIMIPFLAGAFSTAFDKRILSQGVLGILGLLMIIFGLWTSIRLSKQPDA